MNFMIMTVLSLILALGAVFYPSSYPIEQNLSFLATLMIVAGTTFLAIIPLISIFTFIPLQNLEERLVPHLTALFRKDASLNLSKIYLLLFPFLSYIFAAVLILLDIPHKMILFAIWIVLLGVALDLMHHYLRRVLNFLNPSYAIERLINESKRAIQNDKDGDLWQSIDALAEISVRAVKDTRTSLTTQTLNAFPPIVQSFFKASKSIGHTNQDKAVENKTGLDEASYTIFYLLQRLNMINEQAIHKHLEAVCDHLITVLGKIIYYSAQFDMSMVSFPTHHLGQFAIRDLQHHMNHAGDIATSTLVEISKRIVNDIDLTYAEIEEPFKTIINSLTMIAKETFKNDKTMNIKVLVQPLKDLKELFQAEKIANHRDTPAILKHIDSVLAEFDALEQVLRTVPAIPGMEAFNPGSPFMAGPAAANENPNPSAMT